MNDEAFRIGLGKHKRPANVGPVDRGMLSSALTREFGNVYLKNNTDATVVSTAGDRYVIAGESEISELAYNFVHDQDTNGLTYTGDENIVLADMSFSLRSGNNQRIGVYLAVNRAGSPAVLPDADRISESEIYLITTGSTAQDIPQTAFIHALIHLKKGDTVYGIVQNTTSDANIIVEFANLVVSKI